MKTDWNKFLGNAIKLYFEDGENPALWHMAYENGRLYLNERPVFSKIHNGILYWNDGTDPQKDITDGSIGRLEDLNGRGLFSGTMMTSQGTVNFKAAVDTKYELIFTGGEFKKYFELVLGSCMENGDLIQTLELWEKGLDTSLAVCRLVPSVKDYDGYFPHIYGTLFPGLDDFTPFTYFDLRIEGGFLRVSGKAWKDEEASCKVPPCCTISGSCLSSDSACDFGGEIAPAVGCGMSQRYRLDQSATPSVEQLFYLPMPSMENVNNNLPEKITNLMLYSISDEQLGFLGNPSRPQVGKELTQEMVDLLKEKVIADFLKGKYFNACLSSILANNECGRCTKMIRDIPNYDKKLSAYYSDTLSTSMSADPGYCALSDRLHAILYVSGMPDLRPFLTNKAQWAVKLHRYALYTQTIDQIVDEYAHEKYSRLQHTSAVLRYLDAEPCIEMDTPQIIPTKIDQTKEEIYKLSYSSNLYYVIINRRLSFNAFALKPNDMVVSKEERALYIDVASKALVKSLLEGEKLPESFEKLRQALKDDIQSGAIKDAAEVVSWLKNIFAEFETVFSGIVDGCIFPNFIDWFAKNPVKSFIVRTCAIVVTQGLMLFCAGVALSNWSKLTPSEKVSNILSASYSVLDVIGFFATQDWSTLSCASKSTQGAASSSSSSRAAGPNELANLAENGSSFPEKVQAAAKKMKMGSKIVGGILTAFAFAISVCDVVSDMKVYGRAAVFGLNIVVCLVNGVAFLATVGFAFISSLAPALIGSCCLAALLPWIGWVCTILGILLSFILYFVRKSELTLQEKYVRDNCVPFVKALEMPKKEACILLSYTPTSTPLFALAT